LGFSFFQLNTNGLRLAQDPRYCAALAEAGLSTVFLQFDGLHAETYRRLRGLPLLAQKMCAIENCIQFQIGVVLVPTLVFDVNLGELGEILDLALSYAPHVRGVHVQPISYFGRHPYSGRSAQRVTLPDVMRALVEQRGAKLKLEDFRPPGCENALCSFHANYVIMPDGKLHALTHFKAGRECACQAEDGAQGAENARRFVARQWTAPDPSMGLNVLNAPSLGEWDVLLERARTHQFCISGMAFQDAWSLDLERLRDCCIHEVSPDGKLIPFCAYNLTAADGRGLYRHERSFA
jgi:uncharacterized radical SAM superfamily Fe-S cluster-containing enzyme